MKPTVPRACFNAVDRKANPIASDHVSSLVHLILPFQFHAWTKHPDQRSRSAQGAFQKMTSLHFYFSFPSYSCFLVSFVVLTTLRHSHECQKISLLVEQKTSLTVPEESTFLNCFIPFQLNVVAFANNLVVTSQTHSGCSLLVSIAASNT